MMHDVALPSEAAGGHGAATDEIIRLAVEMLVAHAGARIRISARAVATMPNGSLAFAFTGDQGEFLDFAWVRQDAPETITPHAAPLTPEQAEIASIRFGLSLLVIDAGGRLRLPPFDPNRLPQGVLTYGSEPDGGYSLTLIQTS